MLSRTHGGDGFTLAEIIVVVAVLALLAAMVVVQVGQRVRGGESAALAQSLAAVQKGVAQFRADVRRYPSTLRYLGNPLAVGDTDVCGQLIPVSLRTRWAGPYLQQTVPAAGLKVGNAIVRPALSATAPGAFGLLQVIADSVDQAIAVELDSRFDGTADLNAGTIRWTATGQGMGQLRFMTPIRGC